MTTQASRIKDISAHIQESINLINSLILSTPSGTLRNELCDTHLHLQAARDHAERAEALAQE